MFFYQKQSARRDVGESSVWLTSMGLAGGVVMVVFLIGLILVNGLSVFWPKTVYQFNIKSKTDDVATVVAGKIVLERNARIQSEAGDVEEIPEVQIFTGNRDVYGQSFRFFPEHHILNKIINPDAMEIERTEYGSVIAMPVSIKLADGSEILFTDKNFNSELNKLIDEAGDRREEINHIERTDIGAINLKMEKLRIKQKVLTEKNISESDERFVKMNKAVEELQKKFELLAAKARELRSKQTEASLHFQLVSGEDKSVALGHIVRAYYPNRLGFFSKIKMFFGNVYSFLVEDPREANTEGGIFPAIFGTCVMTILMSIVVMPFGVLAAIYLREYAKQGLFVRMVRISVNNLAGVPSIVFGVFGVGFFVYMVGGTIDSLFFSNQLPTPTFGTGGILWAALTLALMTVPVVIVSTEEALASVPRGVHEGSLAMGASKWQTIRRVVLPACAPGILTGLILSMARGAGEVAPLMLVGVVKLAPTLAVDGIFPFLHLDRKFMHLGFHIYDLGFQSPDAEAAKPMVFATTLVLVVIILLLNLGAITLREKLRKKYQSKAF